MNIIFDAHQDILWYENNVKNKTQTSFEMLVQSSIKIVNGTLFIDFSEYKNMSSNEKVALVFDQITQYEYAVKKYPNLTIIKSRNDIDEVLNTDKTGIILHIEGADFIDQTNSNALYDLYEKGLRSFGPMWIYDNMLGSAAGTSSVNGLTDLGKKVITQCENLGIIIDAAHANDQTFTDIVNETQNPFMVSHTNLRSVCDTPRNITTGQIDSIKKRSGVFGIFFSGKYVNNKNTPTIDDVMLHIDKAYMQAPQNLMIGSDFGGITSGLVTQLESINDLPKLGKLIENTYGENAMIDITYKNYLNFLMTIL